MALQTYSASKSRSNRPGWTVTFRHPLRNDARGRPGLKMRRGLNTPDDAEADKLVAEMNALLSDASWWNATKRLEAERRFSKIVVDAFYDEIQAGREDPAKLRDAEIRLPDAEDGYSRVLFVGTTGAGKTSLLRQMIGSDPDDDRFPSTAPAKTTIADIEVIQAESDFQAVVTFFSEFQTQANIEECIVDAALAAHEGATIDKIAERFLSHRDQRFRLNYILGNWGKPADSAEDDEFSFDAQASDEPDDDIGLTEANGEANRLVVEGFVQRVSSLANSTLKKLSDDLDLPPASAAGSDREAAEQLIEENFENYLMQDDGFHDLVQDVLDAIRARFELVTVGALQKDRSGWPLLWLYNTTDRRDFIGHIRWFSSNYWPEFGRLLTPLVEGIRVKGPLFPAFAERKAKLVLLDGQGLGHTPDSSSSVTTQITKKFGEVDVILLVDNAQQPMQAAPLSVLRSIVSSGHNDKLAIAFTHFDQIKGQNLRTSADKRAHVMASVLNAMSNLRDVLGAPVVRSMEHGIDGRCFMLGGVDQNLTRLPGKAADYMRNELARIVEFCEEAIQPPPLPDARPVYDPTGISFAVRDAISKFQGPWAAKLGLGSYEGARKEHWTRIKALNKRIAGELNPDYEYDTLKPVADLVARMTEAISRFLDAPIDWTRPPADEQEQQTAIAPVRRLVSAAMHDLAIRRLVQDHLGQWRSAFDDYGTGSTFRRARAIEGIYGAAAPLPDTVMPPPTKEFLSEVRRVITTAIEASGGKVELEREL